MERKDRVACGIVLWDQSKKFGTLEVLGIGMDINRDGGTKSEIFYGCGYDVAVPELTTWGHKTLAKK